MRPSRRSRSSTCSHARPSCSRWHHRTGTVSKISAIRHRVGPGCFLSASLPCSRQRRSPTATAGETGRPSARGVGPPEGRPHPPAQSGPPEAGPTHTQAHRPNAGPSVPRRPRRRRQGRHDDLRGSDGRHPVRPGQAPGHPASSARPAPGHQGDLPTSPSRHDAQPAAGARRRRPAGPGVCGGRMPVHPARRRRARGRIRGIPVGRSAARAAPCRPNRRCRRAPVAAGAADASATGTGTPPRTGRRSRGRVRPPSRARRLQGTDGGDPAARPGPCATRLPLRPPGPAPTGRMGTRPGERRTDGCGPHRPRMSPAPPAGARAGPFARKAAVTGSRTAARTRAGRNRGQAAAPWPGAACPSRWPGGTHTRAGGGPHPTVPPYKLRGLYRRVDNGHRERRW